MVVIRLSKSGVVHRPFYHVVVTDSRERRDSNYIERLGFLNYFASGQEKTCEINMQRLEHWIEKGAIMRPSVSKIVKNLKREAKMTPEELEKYKARKAKRAKAKAIKAATELAKSVEAKEEAKVEVKEEVKEEAKEEKTETNEEVAKTEEAAPEVKAEEKPAEEKPAEPEAENKS